MIIRMRYVDEPIAAGRMTCKYTNCPYVLLERHVISNNRKYMCRVMVRYLLHEEYEYEPLT